MSDKQLSIQISPVQNKLYSRIIEVRFDTPTLSYKQFIIDCD